MAGTDFFRTHRAYLVHFKYVEKYDATCEMCIRDRLKAALKHQEKRYAELDILLKKVYEDNALGRLPVKRYEMLLAKSEKEQAELEQSMKACREDVYKRQALCSPCF